MRRLSDHSDSFSAICATRERQVDHAVQTARDGNPKRAVRQLREAADGFESDGMIGDAQAVRRLASLLAAEGGAQ